MKFYYFFKEIPGGDKIAKMEFPDLSWFSRPIALNPLTFLFLIPALAKKKTITYSFTSPVLLL